MDEPNIPAFQRDSVLALCLGGAVFLLCFFAAPGIESGLNDDWSYAYVVKGYAATGHANYFGFTAAWMGVQLWLSAWAVHLFGFSFLLLRRLTAVTGAGCAAIEFLLLREVGAKRSVALFGAAALALSPIVFPNSITFMTDVPGAFFVLLALWLGMRSFRASSRHRAIWWLSAAWVAAISGISIRQNLLLLPLLMFPGIAFLRRRERAIGATCVGLTLLAAAVYPIGTHVMASVENVLTRAGSASLVLEGLRSPWRMVVAGERVVVNAAFFLLPAMLGFLRGRMPGWKAWLAVVAAACGLGLAWPLPIYGNTMTRWGYLGVGQTLIGQRPEVLGTHIRMILTVLLIAGLALTAIAVWQRLRGGALPAMTARFAVIALPFAVALLVVIASRAPGGFGLTDRYVIPIVAIFTVLLLSLPEQRIWWPALALVLSMFAFEWAAVHDYVQEWESRLQVTAKLTVAGIDRHQIAAGKEADAVVQIQTTGMLDPDPAPRPSILAIANYSRRFTAMPYEYFISRSPMPDTAPAPGPLGSPVCFSQILPPFQGCVTALQFLH